MKQENKLIIANSFLLIAIIAYIVGIFLMPPTEGIIIISQFDYLIIKKDIFFNAYFSVFIPWIIISMIIGMLMRVEERKQEIILAICWLFFAIMYSCLSTLADIEFLSVSICLLMSGICGVIYAAIKLHYIEYDLFKKEQEKRKNQDQIARSWKYTEQDSD